MRDEIRVGSKWRSRGGGFVVEVMSIRGSHVMYRVPTSGSVCETGEQDFRGAYTPLDDPEPAPAEPHMFATPPLVGRDVRRAEPAPRETPAHYESDVEPLVAIRAWGLNFALGCVVKHVARAGRKGPRLDDLIKARAYLDDEIAAEKGAAK